jgi:hypothetical protein
LITALPSYTAPVGSQRLWGLVSRCDNGAYLSLELEVATSAALFEAAVNRVGALMSSAKIGIGSPLVGDWVREGETVSFSSDGTYYFRIRIATGFDRWGTYTLQGNMLTLNQTGIQGIATQRCRVMFEESRLSLDCDGNSSSYVWKRQ